MNDKPRIIQNPTGYCEPDPVSKYIIVGLVVLVSPLVIALLGPLWLLGWVGAWVMRRIGLGDVFD